MVKISESSVIKREKPTVSFINYFYIVSATLASFVLVYIFFISGFFGASSINIEGDRVVNESEIHDTVRPVLEQKYFLFFERGNNFIFLDSDELERLIRTEYRNIESVKVNQPFLGGLEINIKKAEPVLIFRTGQDFITVSRDGYKLDIVREDVAGELQIPIISTETELKDIDIDGQLIDPDVVKFNVSISEKIRALTDYYVTDVHIDLFEKGKIAEFTLSTGTKVKTYINLGTDYTINQIIKTLEKVDLEQSAELGIYFKETVYVKCRSGSNCIR